jgi:hypothetical protein
VPIEEEEEEEGSPRAIDSRSKYLNKKCLNI